MKTPLHIQVASQVADILHHEGTVPKAPCQLIMDRLADALAEEKAAVLMDLLLELQLAVGMRDGELPDYTGEEQ